MTLTKYTNQESIIAMADLINHEVIIRSDAQVVNFFYVHIGCAHTVSHTLMVKGGLLLTKASFPTFAKLSSFAIRIKLPYPSSGALISP